MVLTPMIAERSQLTNTINTNPASFVTTASSDSSSLASSEHLEKEGPFVAGSPSRSSGGAMMNGGSTTTEMVHPEKDSHSNTATQQPAPPAPVVEKSVPVVAVEAAGKEVPEAPSKSQVVVAAAAAATGDDDDDDDDDDDEDDDSTESHQDPFRMAVTSMAHQKQSQHHHQPPTRMIQTTTTGGGGGEVMSTTSSSNHSNNSSSVPLLHPDTAAGHASVTSTSSTSVGGGVASTTKVSSSSLSSPQKQQQAPLLGTSVSTASHNNNNNHATPTRPNLTISTTTTNSNNTHPPPPRIGFATSTTTTTPTSQSRTGGASNYGGVTNAQGHAAGVAGAASTILMRPVLLVESHAAVRVIKGEIHTVLTVMRADPRYVSSNRFFSEEACWNTHGSGSSTSTTSTTFSSSTTTTMSTTANHHASSAPTSTAAAATATTTATPATASSSSLSSAAASAASVTPSFLLNKSRSFRLPAARAASKLNLSTTAEEPAVGDSTTAATTSTTTTNKVGLSAPALTATSSRMLLQHQTSLPLAVRQTGVHPLVQEFQELQVALIDWDMKQAGATTDADGPGGRGAADLETNLSGSLPTTPASGMRLTSPNNNTTPNHRAAPRSTTSSHGAGAAAAAGGSSATGNGKPPDCMLYLPPFLHAVQSREVSAAVKGAALAALRKFLVYGFILALDEMIPVASAADEEGEVATTPTTTTNLAATGMNAIALSLLHCKFEDSTTSPPLYSSAAHDASSVAAGGGISGSLAAVSAVVAPIDPNLERRRNYGAQRSAEEEQVVLKLLDLAVLLVRCSLQQSASVLLETDHILGLIDTCLYVSHKAHRASPLLKSAASDALSQIVLQVFGSWGPAVQHVRPALWRKLSSLLNPGSEHATDLSVIASSLTAINMALETCRKPLYDQEIAILQNDLCKYLLQWSTTHDLRVLILTLRVIFNLFQSHSNHLKVQLEVFLTSVHLRILATAAPSVANTMSPSGGGGVGGMSGGGPDALSSSATSATESVRSGSEVSNTNSTSTVPNKSHIHYHYPTDGNKNSARDYHSSQSSTVLPPEEREAALESLLEFCQEPALMQDIYTNYDCDVACTNLYESIVATLAKVALPSGWRESKHNLTMNGGSSIMGDVSGLAPYNKNQNSGVGLNHLNRLATEGILAILDSIARRCQLETSKPSSSPSSTGGGAGVSLSTFFSDGAGGGGGSTSGGGSEAGGGADNKSRSSSDDGSIEYQSQVSDYELGERRRKKNAMWTIAKAFNSDPMGKGWINLAVEEDIIESETDAEGIAELFYTAPLDKVKLGIYLSKGPEKHFPFHAEVRKHFVSLYNFQDLSFSVALRKFLSKFRLPGEAQCIDRLMEAFSKELYKQQSGKTFFVNADAVYVLSFSTIMLNTDLHNPTIKKVERMTQKQFVRNNRGINGGADLPEEFLNDLYDQIKAKQIQVTIELGDIMDENEDFRTAWEGILSKSSEVATPSFTPSGSAWRYSMKAGYHDKEMFEVLARWALQCLPAVFMKSNDDSFVVRTLKGLQKMAKIAAYFDLDSIVNEILLMLLKTGREYAMNIVALDYNNYFENGVRLDDDEDQNAADKEQPIPYGLLCSSRNPEVVDITGSAAHRGLLAIDRGFVLVGKYARRVTTAWVAFIECLCALRDARALPTGLSDLDDFADSSGNVLPLSIYARASQSRIEEHYKTSQQLAEQEQSANKQKGWFRSLFNKKGANATVDNSLLNGDDGTGAANKGGLSTAAKALLSVAEAADVENIVQMGSTKLPAAEQTIRSLLGVLSEYPYDDDPVKEQHALFSLELAARALLSNRDRAVELFTVFLEKFETVMAKATDTNVAAPFVIERIVVTVLRCSIHLYDIERLRPKLRASLHLLMMALPRTFIRQIADRMACGLAIILRASFHYFETPNEWTFMGDTLDILANYGSARVFVFDGIASTVEYSLPQGDLGHEDEYEGERPVLSKDACAALSRILIRYVLGFYQGDMSLTVPAMLCLEKVYRHKVDLLLQEQMAGENPPQPVVDSTYVVPDKEFWQNVAVAVYSVCRSTDPEVSRHGYECYSRLIIQTPLDQIPIEKWIAILYLMVSKQPPVAAGLSRANCLVALGQMLIKVLPVVSHNEDDREDLVDLISQTAALSQENLVQGRRGNTSPLFEKTLQTVTYISNHMVTDEWKGEPEFSHWASETLLAELEKVGASVALKDIQTATLPSPAKASRDGD